MLSRRLLLQFIRINQRQAAFCSIKSEPLMCHKNNSTTNGSSSNLLKSLPKDHKIFDVIGTTDELLTYLGFAREFNLESEFTDKLKRVQMVLIDLSATIASSVDKGSKTAFNPAHNEELNEWIEECQRELPQLEKFIIPGGGKGSAALLVARSICRRAERTVYSMVREGQLDSEAAVYLERLAKFLLAASRIAAKQDKRTETIYTPKPST